MSAEWTRYDSEGREKAVTVAPRSSRRLLPIIFLVSGATGISYEILWQRFAVDIVGGETTAVALVVSLVFVGLGLGSWLGTQVVTRTRSPKMVYGLVEIGIGATAGLVPLIMPWCSTVGGQSITMSVVVVLLVMAIPATLIGATFPAMVMLFRAESVTGRVGIVYSANLAGAVVGSLSLTFLVLPQFGRLGTSSLLAAVNVAIGVLVMLLPIGTEPTSSPNPPLQRSEQGWHLLEHWALGLAAVSGALSMGIQVLFTRALALTAPGSVYMFGLVLSAYLLGLVVGAAAIVPWFRRRTPTARHLYGIYLASACVLFATVWSLQWFRAAFRPALKAMGAETWSAYLASLGGFSMLLLVPATALMGAAFPLLVSVASGHRSVTSSAGRLYSSNTIGGALGSIAGLFLMPWLGLVPAMLAVSASYAGLAIVTAFLAPAERRSRLHLLAGTVVVAIVAMSVRLQPNVHGDGRGKTLYRHDGTSGTITVEEHRPRVLRLAINNNYGLNVTTPGTVEMQYRLGHLPVLIHGEPEKALLLGFATGNTLAAVQQGIPAGEIHCVELHKTLFDLARFFEDVNHRVAHKPEVRLIPGDGRRYLRTSNERYDLIIGDLYLPRNPGVGAMYSREHFQGARSSLNSDGVFVAWVPLFQMDRTAVSSVVAAFTDVFTNAVGIIGHAHGTHPVLGLVGVHGDRRIVWTSALESELSERVLESIKRIPYVNSFRTREQVSLFSHGGGRLTLGYRQLKDLADLSDPNTLDNNIVEFRAPRALLSYQLRGEPLGASYWQPFFANHRSATGH